jgi:phosphoglycerate dehydrogenase-like enzyme
MAEYGKAFGMEIIAWSQNLTAEAAAAVGVTRVEKNELLARNDVLSIHVVLSERTRGLIGAAELALMKPTAILINTSRGPIVDEAALIEALAKSRLRGAGLDVYDREPLPDDSPLRRLDNIVLTPHLGYASEEGMRIYYEDTVEAVEAFLDGKPIRVVNPEALPA